jgi:hypothetical protein
VAAGKDGKVVWIPPEEILAQLADISDHSKQQDRSARGN